MAHSGEYSMATVFAPRTSSATPCSSCRRPAYVILSPGKASSTNGSIA
jgi:hypothetical protein